MADFITTYTGVHFFPLEPERSEIRIEDIAHSLSLLCRANGHYRSFYSVADHCIDCAYEAEARELDIYIVKACLLHDAAEAYISDIPRPVKGELNGIDIIEQNLENAVYIKFLGRVPTEEESKIIKEIDDCMLYYEFKTNMGEELKYCGRMHSNRTFASQMPFEAEQEYLDVYKRFT